MAKANQGTRAHARRLHRPRRTLRWATHREVAEVICGTKDVREQWSARGGWMKERMRRALAKGQALCDGGYWKLVEQACRFKS